jgi:hypothetical protein
VKGCGGRGNEYKMVPEIKTWSLWKNVHVAQFRSKIYEQFSTLYSMGSNEAED